MKDENEKTSYSFILPLSSFILSSSAFHISTTKLLRQSADGAAEKLSAPYGFAHMQLMTYTLAADCSLHYSRYHMIQFDDVVVCYAPHDRYPVNALDHINLEIEAGEWVFIVGSSGAGKSTLLKLIYGGAQATSGRILVACRRAPFPYCGAKSA